MAFVFQQPGEKSLLEAINTAAHNSSGGGGLFAFATKGGIEAFFALPNITSLLNSGFEFQLIVGVDAITNSEALLSLQDKVRQYGPGLKVSVFYHENAFSTFHPKFSWFLTPAGVSLITGSGNLTERGLGVQRLPEGKSSNWEAFSLQSLSGDDAEIVVGGISTWFKDQADAGALCELNDARVVEKAFANAQVRYAPNRNKKKIKAFAVAVVPEDEIQERVVVQTVAVEPEPDLLDVLVRELPSTRGGQGDIGREAHSEFFGHSGTDKYIYMQFVELGDKLHPVKKVWLFYNPASANYRLELPESKVDYEIGASDERMILVATRLDSRSFRYTLLRPLTDKKYYDQVASLLGPIKRGGRRLMRQNFISSGTLKTVWPEAPSSLLPLPLPVSEPE